MGNPAQLADCKTLGIPSYLGALRCARTCGQLYPRVGSPMRASKFRKCVRWTRQRWLSDK